MQKVKEAVKAGRANYSPAHDFSGGSGHRRYQVNRTALLSGTPLKGDFRMGQLNYKFSSFANFGGYFNGAMKFLNRFFHNIQAQA